MSFLLCYSTYKGFEGAVRLNWKDDLGRRGMWREIDTVHTYLDGTRAVVPKTTATHEARGASCTDPCEELQSAVGMRVFEDEVMPEAVCIVFPILTTA